MYPGISFLRLDSKSVARCQQTCWSLRVFVCVVVLQHEFKSVQSCAFSRQICTTFYTLGKLSGLSQLFYNWRYSDGTRQSPDLLVQTICKKKSKRHQRKKDVLKEELQFSTCHKGYCVQIDISRSLNETSRTLDPLSYHVSFDLQLNEASQRLLEYLISRKSLEDFVKQFVWKEIENLAS